MMRMSLALRDHLSALTTPTMWAPLSKLWSRASAPSEGEQFARKWNGTKGSPVSKRGEMHGRAHELFAFGPSLQRPLLCHHYLPVDSSSVAPCQHLLLPRQSRLLYHRKSVMRQTIRHSREATSFAMLD